MSQPKFVEKLVPEGSVREDLYERRVRRSVRYLLFRLATAEEEGGAKAPRMPAGFKPFFEKQEWFDGWANFGRTWDVGNPDNEDSASDDPLEVVPRWQSIHEEWEEVLTSELKANEIAARKRRRASGSQSQLQSDD